MVDIYGESISEIIDIPMQSSRLSAFFELLETRKMLQTVEETVEALLAAEYFGLNLTSSQLNEMICDLDLDDQSRPFLLQAGFTTISIPALLYLINHEDELISYARPLSERTNEVVNELIFKDKITIGELISRVITLCPLKQQVIMESLLDGINLDVEIAYYGMIRHMMPKLVAIYSKTSEGTDPAIDMAEMRGVIMNAVNELIPGPGHGLVIGNVPIMQYVGGHNMQDVIGDIGDIIATDSDEEDQ
jgi:hypothetical protein